MKADSIKILNCLLLLSGFLAANAFAATLTVTKASDTADGVCDTDCSLREAVATAGNDDVIVFSMLFDTPQTITLTGGQITITKNLTIAGTGANLLTVSGNNASRIFDISSGAVVALSRMRLADGRITTAAAFSLNGGAIYLTGSTLTLTSMTLSNNKAFYPGPPPPPTYPPTPPPLAVYGFAGAVYSTNSTLTINNSTIKNNSARFGGAIYSGGGIVNVIGSTINNNEGDGVVGTSADSGLDLLNVVSSFFNGNSGSAVSGNGRTSVISSIITSNGNGIYSGKPRSVLSIDSHSVLTIDRTIISNNFGNGVFNNGSATISKTTVNNNNRLYGGSGIINTGTINIMSSAITNNRAFNSGGGIYNASGQLYLTNSTVSGNVVVNGSGGGIYNSSDSFNPGGNLILTNSTIANNHAKGPGGGLRQDITGTITIRNTIIAENSSEATENDVSGTIVSQGFNLIGNSTSSSGWTATDLLNRNPLLALLGNNGGPTLTHALLPGSPAINSGSNALAKDPITNNPLDGDQRGYSRFRGGMGSGTVDIGAFESNVAASPVTLSGRVLTSSGRGISNARITLTDANGAVTYAQTNSLGNYRFTNLPFGSTYTITVSYKRYRFNSPQIITVDKLYKDLNFTASQ